MKNKFVQLIVFSLVQIVLFIILYTVGNLIIDVFRPKVRGDLHWGVTVNIISYIFYCVSILIAILMVFVNKPLKFVYGVIILFLLVVLFLIRDVQLYPFKTIFIVICVLSAFIGVILIQSKLTYGSSSK